MRGYERQRRGSGLRRRWSGAPEQRRPPTLSTTRAPPCPPGWTEAELLEIMRGFAIDDLSPGDLRPYADDAFWRFLHSWGLVSELDGTALELGANPYFISFLLQEFTSLDVRLANFFGHDEGPASQELRWTARGGTARRRELTYDQFNLEEGRFPYADATFDVVLFCEILEHLLMDPAHALREIRRVLKPGGRLVISTPNVCRLENVLAMIAGTNIYDPYSGFGPYGRHNREYTMGDLERLVSFTGFTVEHRFTADAHPVPTPYEARPGYAAVAPELSHRATDLGQYLFMVARATSAPRPGLPRFLYRSYPESELVDDAV